MSSAQETQTAVATAPAKSAVVRDPAEELELQGGIGGRQGRDNPFGDALDACRKVESKNPTDAEKRFIAAAFDLLDERGQNGAINVLVKEAFGPDGTITPVFNAARYLRKMPVAYSAAALRKARNEGKLSLVDMKKAGLLDAELVDGKLKITRYNIRLDNFRDAVPLLREMDKVVAAKVLEEHVAGVEKKQKRRAAEEEKDAEEGDLLALMQEESSDSSDETQAPEAADQEPEVSAESETPAEEPEAPAESPEETAPADVPLSEMDVEGLLKIVANDGIKTAAKQAPGLVKAIERHRAKASAG